MWGLCGGGRKSRLIEGFLSFAPGLHVNAPTTISPCQAEALYNCFETAAQRRTIMVRQVDIAGEGLVHDATSDRPRFAELSMVTIRHPFDVDGRTLPTGTK